MAGTDPASLCLEGTRSTIELHPEEEGAGLEPAQPAFTVGRLATSCDTNYATLPFSDLLGSQHQPVDTEREPDAFRVPATAHNLLLRA